MIEKWPLDPKKKGKDIGEGIRKDICIYTYLIFRKGTKDEREQVI